MTYYGRVSLFGVLADLRDAAAGTRNDALNKAAFRIGQLIADKHVDYDTAHQELRETVAPWIGQPGGDGKPFTWSEFEATARSGLTGGKANPRANAPAPSSSRVPVADWLDLPRQPATAASNGAPPDVDAQVSSELFDELYIDATELEKIPQPEPLIEGVLYGGTTFSITGRDRTYKSFLAYAWLCSLATGLPWLGRPSRRVRVLYVVGEGASGLAGRRNAWQTAWRAELEPGWLTVRLAPVNLFKRGADIAELIDRIERERYGVVLFDTLARNASGGNLNLPDDASTVIDTLDRVRRATGDGAAGYVAHTDKGDRDTRGAGNLEDDLDVVWHVKRGGDDGEPAPIVATLAKRKDGGPDGEQIRLRPNPVEGTGSLVLEAFGGIDATLRAASPPKHAFAILKLLAGSAVRDDGMSMSALADGLGLGGKGSVSKATSWLIDAEYAESRGSGRNSRIVLTVQGSSKLAEIGENPS